mgnify:CR=1 FL=1
MVAVLTRGVTVVVSPLISLMQDQVQALLATGEGIPALAINSTLSETQSRSAYRELARGPEAFIKLLYVAPETLVASTTLMQILRELNEQVRG